MSRNPPHVRVKKSGDKRSFVSGNILALCKWNENGTVNVLHVLTSKVPKLSHADLGRLSWELDMFFSLNSRAMSVNDFVLELLIKEEWLKLREEFQKKLMWTPVQEEIMHEAFANYRRRCLNEK